MSLETELSEALKTIEDLRQDCKDLHYYFRKVQELEDKIKLQEKELKAFNRTIGLINGAATRYRHTLESVATKLHGVILNGDPLFTTKIIQDIEKTLRLE